MRIVCALLPLVLVCSCGYVGDPLPPALNVPNRVTDLAVVQRGDKIVLDFTIPPLTTENLPIRHLAPAEVQVGDKLLKLTANKPGHFTEEIDAKDWVGQQPGIKIRLNNDRGRYSEWSNEVSLNVIEPLPAPSSVVAADDPKGVKVTWQSPARPGQSWRVFRGDAKEPIAVVDRPEYVDPGTEYGNEYSYRVQAVAGKSESPLSAATTWIPKRVFPPPVPAHVTGLQGIDSVELNWDPITETDLRGYRVYRSVNGGPAELVADNVETPSYSDKKVTGNQTYRYSVTAVDQVGNESGKSQVVEIKTR